MESIFNVDMMLTTIENKNSLLVSCVQSANVILCNTISRGHGINSVSIGTVRCESLQVRDVTHPGCRSFLQRMLCGPSTLFFTSTRPSLIQTNASFEALTSPRPRLKMSLVSTVICSLTKTGLCGNTGLISLATRTFLSFFASSQSALTLLATQCTRIAGGLRSLFLAGTRCATEMYVRYHVTESARDSSSNKL